MSQARPLTGPRAHRPEMCDVQLRHRLPPAATVRCGGHHGTPLWPSVGYVLSLGVGELQRLQAIAQATSDDVLPHKRRLRPLIIRTLRVGINSLTFAVLCPNKYEKEGGDQSNSASCEYGCCERTKIKVDEQTDKHSGM